MDKEQQAKKQQMILIVSIFLAVIIVAWIISLEFTLFNADKNEGDGSVKNILNNLEQSVESFSNDISDNDVDFSDIVDNLKDRFNEEKNNVESITESMIAKLNLAKLESWQEYSDDMIEFKYPADWSLVNEENIISLNKGDEDILSITVYTDPSQLPDNINSLELIGWLDEQVNRDLGIFMGYSLEAMDTELEMYNVNFKEDTNIARMYWENEGAVYSINYILDDEIDSIIKLIISTIK